MSTTIFQQEICPDARGVSGADSCELSSSSDVLENVLLEDANAAKSGPPFLVGNGDDAFFLRCAVGDLELWESG